MDKIQEIVSRQAEKGQKGLAVLIDPDKYSDEALIHTIGICDTEGVDFIFTGGSLLMDNRLETLIGLIKENSNIPVVLFPGNGFQICELADGILLLSLVSGRNADLLIGQHVTSAPLLRASRLEIIPTAYILVDGGQVSTTQYISNTQPIPANKHDIAVCTAMAAEMLGMKMVYLEAGSGALQNVPEAMIRKVKSNISVPLFVGGGIRTSEQAERIYKSGCDLIVIGNAVENDKDIIRQISRVKKQFP